jgi:hypothetical protein
MAAWHTYSAASRFSNILETFICFKTNASVSLLYTEKLCRQEINNKTANFVLLTVHLDILCNENQLDALFVFDLFRQSTSTCFGHVYCPSSGGIHCIYIQQLVCFIRLTLSNPIFCHPDTPLLLFILGWKEVGGLLVRTT